MVSAWVTDFGFRQVNGMRQTLFAIPLDGPWVLGPIEVPGFGFGLALLLWALFAAFWLWRMRRRGDKPADMAGMAALFGVVALVIVFVPRFARASHLVAIDHLTRAIAEHPDDASLYQQRAAIWRTLRNHPEALSDYEKSIELLPNNGPLRAQLAWHLATSPDASVRDGARAEQIAREAVDLATPESFVPAYEALAAAEAARGDFVSAVENQRRVGRFLAASGEFHSERVAEVRKRIARYEAEEPLIDRGSPPALPIYGYGFMLFTGFISAGWTAARRGATVGISKENIWDIAMWCFFGGIVGGRLFYCIQYYDNVFGTKTGFDWVKAAVNLPDGGLVLYGGFIAGLASYLAFCAVRKIDPLKMADVLAPSWFIGLGFGRLGCLLNGCCYGDRCTLPWASEFPLGSVPDVAMVLRGFLSADSPASIALHPTQIYSALDGFVLALLLHFYFKVRERDGILLSISLIVYALTRFLIEFLRGDEMGQFNTSLTISQWISLGMLLVGIIYTVWLFKFSGSKPLAPSQLTVPW